MKEMYTAQSSSSESTPKMPLISVVTPAFNEADNLPLLYDKLCQVLAFHNINWEWVVVDDHSVDETYEVIAALAQQDSRVRGLRFARNFGSHTALMCGLRYAKGDCAVVMAADLQDPPEILPDLFVKWHEGAHVVWAVRRQRNGISTINLGFSRLYYYVMRHVVGMKEMPSTGADFFLIDKTIIKALRQFHESHVSVLALITWMGYRQTYIHYDKQERVHGKSGWTIEKKIRMVLDSVTSFSYLPIRLMSYVGMIVAILGLLYAGYIIGYAVFGYALFGEPPEGWSSIMVVVLVLGGIQMLMMGILGEYLWRSLDESRQRPHYLIETATDQLSDKT